VNAPLRRTAFVACLLVMVAGPLAAASCGDDPPAAMAEAGAEVPADAMPATPPDAAVDATAFDAAEAGARPLVNTCGDAGALPETWLADPRLCLSVFANQVVNGRQLAFAPNGDLFALANTQIIALFDTNKDLVIADDERSLFAASVDGAPAFTHSVVFSPDGAFLYASNLTTVYRWAYKAGDHVATGAPEVVVSNMPTDGHDTRTLVFDAQHRLYVNVGSAGDFDYTPQSLALRSMVRRFTLPATLPAGGLDYAEGEVFASGLRNEVGLTFDSKGRMWGVENGVDALGEDNPAEELNRLDSPTRFFGHPNCYSEYRMDGGLGAGSQWAIPAFDNTRTDAWCRDPKNVQRPAAAMPAHWAPLGVTEYTGGSLPWQGDLIIASHGSFFRTIPVGRVLARAHLVGDTVQSITPIVGHGVDGGLEEGTWDARPVDVRMGSEGALYFTENFSHRILRLGFRP